MAARYDALKLLGVVGTALSFYKAVVESIPMEDIIIILTASLLFLAIMRDLEKSRKKARAAVRHSQTSLNNATSHLFKSLSGAQLAES